MLGRLLHKLKRLFFWSDPYQSRLVRLSLLAYGALLALAAEPVGFMAAGWLAPLFGLRYMYLAPPGFSYLGLVLMSSLALTPAAFTLYAELDWVALYVLLQSLLLAIPYQLQRWLRPLFSPVAHSLVFPACYVSVAYLSGELLPGGALLSLAQTQVEFQWLAQSAALLGPWSITFLLTWFGASLHLALIRRAPGRSVRVQLFSLFAVALLLLASGFTRQFFLQGPYPGAGVAVGVLPGFQSPQIVPEPALPQQADRRFVASAELQGLSLLAWPSARYLPAEESDQERVRQAWQQLSTAYGVPLLTPFRYVGQQNEYPLVAWWMPNGGQTRYYQPGVGWRASWPTQQTLDANTPSSQASAQQSAEPTLVRAGMGVALTHWNQLDLPGHNRALGGDNIRLLLVLPSINQVTHARLPALQLAALETGANALGVDQRGLTALATASGQLAYLRRPSTYTNLVVVRTPVAPGVTLYNVLGDWVAWLCMAWTVLMSLRFGWRVYRRWRNRTSRADSPPSEENAPADTQLQSASEQEVTESNPSW